MLKYKLIAFILAMLLLFQIIPVMAATTDDVNIFPIEDSYIVSGQRWKHKNYGSSANLLFGETYDRTTLMKFDLSNIDLSSYDGALLDLTFNAAYDNEDIRVYLIDDDWDEKSIKYDNFHSDYNFLVSSSVSKGPEQHLTLTLNNVLQLVKNKENKIISIALKSDSKCISVFSSESSNVSTRPRLTLTENSAYIRDQYDFEFPRITKEQVKADMQKLIAKGHPYLYADNDTFNMLRENSFGKNEFLTQQYSMIKAEATEILSEPVMSIATELENNAQFLSKGVAIYERICKLALVYKIEGDDRFAQKAWEHIEDLCSQKDWGKRQLIDRAQIYFGIAIGYDWLYDWLNESQKDTIGKKTKELSFDEILDVYKNPTKPEYKWAFHQLLMSTQNHGIVNSCMTFILAMSIAEYDIDFMSEVMVESFNFLITPLKVFYPDGDFEEGASYWTMGGPFASKLFQALNYALGHLYGYENVDFSNMLSYFPIYSTGDGGTFVSGDAHFDFDGGFDLSFFISGEFSNNKSLQTYALRLMKERNIADVLTYVTYDPEETYNADMEMDLDKLFRRAGQVTMRSSFEGNQNTFVGMKSIEEPRIDIMLDRGTLAFNAFGERWIANHGREVYYEGYVTEEKYTLYRTRPESHSCILVNPSEYRGQERDRGTAISVFKSDKGGAFAIADLTPAYKVSSKSYKRGIQLTDNRRVFVVQDEIELLKPSEMYSFFNIFNADIDILSDGKSAILSKNNKKVYVTIDCDTEFTLGKMNAEPLPGTALPVSSKPNSPNPDFMKLYLHFEDVESANIRVCFIPYICEEELETITCKEFVPMSEWVAPSEMKVIPMLDDIKIDGVSYHDFNKYNRCYDLEKEVSVSQVEAVYDESKYDVRYKKDEQTGAVNILVVDKSDKNNINSYSLSIPVILKPSFVDTSDMSILPITRTLAPEPQKENGINNLYDGDLSTRWAGKGAGTVMTVELDKVRKVGCIAVNVMEGNLRRQAFDVQLSLDGKTWGDVNRFRTSGVTLDAEYFDLNNTDAKFVKITWNTSNVSNWNSITELKLYGK